MPKLAVFPKAYMQALCKDGTMQVSDWINLAVQLDVEGLEWYAGFLEMKDEKNWPLFRKMVEDHGKTIPMFCCSPDFTHPDSNFRQNEIKKQKKWIDTAYALGASYCRVLSGQRRPGISIAEGVNFASECIRSCLPYAEERKITLILENHYKDDFWEYPEFAQKMDVFCTLVKTLQHPFFGVNYDPSNVLLAGEDPLELLQRVSQWVVTVHASDRYLKQGTIEDLRKEEDRSFGYAQRLSHGEIGKGLNNFDAIFTELKRVGFQGWISIEDGVEGFDQLLRSVRFLRNKINQHWPN
ncbi:MAG: sugar phosphate isomerase/epimerase [Flavisolibacter sp.]